MAELNELRARKLALSEELVALGERKPKDDEEDEAIIGLMEQKEKELAQVVSQEKREARVQAIKAELAKPMTVHGAAADLMVGGPQRTIGGKGGGGGGYGYAAPDGYVVPDGARFRAVEQPWEKPGIAFARFVKCWVAGRQQTDQAQMVAQQLYPDDKRLDFKAVQAANVGTLGGFLVPEQYSRELVEYLRHLSVIRPHARVVPINGTMVMPVQTSGVSATYIGENLDDLAQDITFGQVRFVARTLRALVATSNDLIRNSSPEADMIIRDDLAGGLAEAQDLAFIRGTGVGDSPKGLRYWAASTSINNGSGTTATAIEADLLGMIARLEANKKNQLGQLRWLMPSRTFYKLYQLRMPGGAEQTLVFPESRGDTPLLLGYPVERTNQIPTNLAPGTVTEIYLVDFSDVIIGDEHGIEIAVSDTAAYKDATGTLQSAFSRNQTVLRAIAKHDMVVRRPASVEVLTGSNVTY
jgi:HK97 family phage major capsid protein